MLRLNHLAAALPVLLLLACGFDIPQTPAPVAVRALWDPTTNTVPTPSDLVRDAEAGRLSLPLDPALPEAELELRRFLNELDGYPLSTPIGVPFSAPIDPATLAGNLVVVDVAGGEEVLVAPSFDDTTFKLKLSVPGVTEDGEARPLLAPGHRYLVAVKGYEDGAAGPDGEPVISDAAFHFLKAKESLEEHEAAMPGATRAEKTAAAERLELVRQAYQPAFDALLARGLPREQVAVLTTFTTSARPAVWFDSASGRVPVPNDLLLSEGLVALPPRPDDSPETAAVKAGLATYDGFSTTGPLVVQVTQPLDRDAALDPAAIRLFRLGDPGDEPVEVTGLERGVAEDGLSFWVKPALALEHTSRYAYLVTRAATASGLPLEAQALGALVRSPAPLVVDGRSQVGALSDAEAARVEPVRAGFAPALDDLAGRGIARDGLAAAIPFTTTSAPEQALRLRAELFERDVPTELGDPLARTPLQRGLPLLFVETVVTGTLTTLDHLDPYTQAFRGTGAAVEAPLELVVTIPRSARAGEPIPVVLFGHGLMTSRELVYMIADRLAQAGYAAISVDLPLHGERSICRQDLECAAGSSCAEDGRCVDGSGAPSRLRQVASPWPGGPSYPVTSGTYFVDVEDLFASRDHLAQALLDLSQTVRVIKGADWAAATGGYVLDGDDIVYLGMSLGGILGAGLSAVEPDVESFALNVPGAGLVGLMTESTYFGLQLEQGLSAHGIVKGSPEWFRFETIAHWVLDPVDPINYVQHSVGAPLSYRDPLDGAEKTVSTRRVLIQMAECDLIVPNSSTERLSARMGVPYTSYDAGLCEGATPDFTFSFFNHGFLFDPLSLESARARDELVEFFDAR